MKTEFKTLLRRCALLMGMTAMSSLAGNISFNPPQDRINPGVHLEVAGSEMSFADYDHDGDLDWLARIDYQGILYVFNNRGLDGNGYLSAPRSQIDWFIDDAEFADVNGDGWADVITSSRGNGFRIRLNNQSGGFNLSQTILEADFSPTQQAWRFAVGDVENDGDIDIIVSSYRTSPRYHVLVNDGNGAFSIGWQSPSVPNYQTNWMDMADLDGDGLPELITLGSFNHYNIWQNNGDGTFTGRFAIDPINTGYNIGVQQGRSALGDVDGDGDLDLVITEYNYDTSSPQMSIYENVGDLDNFIRRDALTPPTGQTLGSAVDLADVDGDGDLDLATSFGGTDGLPYIYENDGFGNFFEAWTGGARYPNTTAHVFFADVDGNGMTDLLTFGSYGSTFHGNATVGDPDSDGDGVPDSEDAFPNDASETTDSDGDGVGDNGDAFPNDASESADSDGDGTGDNADDFPNDPTETNDTDGDGVGDNSDEFPNDASESADSDGDGTGDNADDFPNDPTETNDTDGDGVGDNDDAFPNDASDSADSDGDGTGDNADAFPNDATETTDTDGDGTGDNSDSFPNDANENSDSDGDGLGDNSDPFPISDQSPTIIIGGVDSGVANRPFAPGATLSDFLTATLADCAVDAKNHGKVVSCFSKLLNELKKNEIITKKEKGALQKTVSRKGGSSKGSGSSSGKSGSSVEDSGSSAKGGAPAPKKSKGKKGKK